ncbi:hypothetical protein HDU96_006694 [Phlyctochytrium bullatum]|nr:hypothetical protein HDU96_006694 [Phlyctochytrium bullatum]
MRNRMHTIALAAFLLATTAAHAQLVAPSGGSSASVVLNVPSSTVSDGLPLPTGAASNNASSTDPCVALTTALNTTFTTTSIPYATLPQVHACYSFFQLSSTLKLLHLSELKPMVNAYPYFDLNIPTTPRPGLYPSSLRTNLLDALDALAANTSLTSLFDLMSQITLLINRLDDAHFAYVPRCVTRFLFVQPWKIGAVYGGARPVLELVALNRGPLDDAADAVWGRVMGSQPSRFVNWTIKAIDGQDPITVVEDYANRFTGFSHDPSTRFNQVLARLQYLDGAFRLRTGLFSATPFLPPNHPPTRTYTLVPPAGSSATETTLTVPWLALPLPASDGSIVIGSSRTYFFANCLSERAQSLVASQPVAGATPRVDLVGRTVVPVQGGTLVRRADPEPGATFRVPAMPADVSGPRAPATGAESVRALPDDLGAQAAPHAAEALATARKRLAPTTGGLLRARPDGSGPLAQSRPAPDLDRPATSDNYTAFYLLADGETGVWVFSTVSPTNADGSEPSTDAEFSAATSGWLGTVLGGLRSLREAGARRLVVDVSGNGGGYLCLATALAEVMFPGTASPVDNVRLTAATEALIKTDYLGFGARGPAYFNATAANATSFRVDRGGGTETFSPLFEFCRTSGGRLTNPIVAANGTVAGAAAAGGWDVGAVAFVSDGGCGSACAKFVRSVRDTFGVRAYTYGGGASGEAFTPTSFDGGIVRTFREMATYVPALLQRLTAAEREEIPRVFFFEVDGSIPVTQTFSVPAWRGRPVEEWLPQEWVPQPAREQIVVARHWERVAVWNAVAERLKAAGGVNVTGTTTVRPSATGTAEPSVLPATTTGVATRSGAGRAGFSGLFVGGLVAMACGVLFV